jgi:hypothetical protein
LSLPLPFPWYPEVEDVFEVEDDDLPAPFWYGPLV